MISPPVRPPAQENWKLLGTYGTVGLELCLSILVGFFGGQRLDSRFGSSPWFAVIGFGFGTAAGIRFVYRAVLRAQRELDRLDRNEREARSKFHGQPSHGYLSDGHPSDDQRGPKREPSDGRPR